jgi:hypothetical protein
MHPDSLKAKTASKALVRLRIASTEWQAVASPAQKFMVWSLLIKWLPYEILEHTKEMTCYEIPEHTKGNDFVSFDSVGY